ncbi:MAG: ubiquitin-like small modifier protein 2 [Halobacteriaceae archaeon]
MRVTLSVAGDDEHTFEVGGETYADLLGDLGVNRHEVAVLVDGRPVPEDRPADADATVVRLVSGG